MSMKTMVTKMTTRERYIVWLHFERNVVAQNGREQDQIDDVRQALALEEISVRADEVGRGETLDHRDFSDEGETAKDVELTKEELGYLVGVLCKPMPAALVRFALPLRRRLEKERDVKGLKAVAAD